MHIAYLLKYEAGYIIIGKEGDGLGGKTSAKSKNAYNAKAYDRIQLVVKKGAREKIKQYVSDNGYTSINELLKELVSDKTGIEV